MATTRREGEYRALLKHRDVKRWYDQLGQGAPTTARVYASTLNQFLRDYAGGMDPGEYIRLSTKRREDLLIDAINDLATKGRPGAADNVKRAVTSWLDFLGKKPVRSIKVPKASRRRPARERFIPDQDQLRQVLNAADLRAKVAIGLLAMSGCRINMMGNARGDDGLRVRDIVDAKAKDGALEFTKLPARLNIPSPLSKTGRPTFTFVGPELAEYVQGYLGDRRRRCEAIGPNSPLIRGQDTEGEFLKASNVAVAMKKPMLRAGLDLNPYIWRSYFSSRAQLARDLPRDWREFFMNHAGGVAETYALHKVLNPDVVEEMRRAYESALSHLEATRHQTEDPTVKMASFFLLAAGYSQEEVEDMDLGSKSREEVVDLIRRARGAVAANGNGGQPRGPRQKVIPPKDLQAAIAGGWLWRANLPDGQVLVETRGPT